MRSGDGVHIGSIAAGSYGRFDGAVTREVSLKKRAALGQLVPQPLSSSALPRPPPASARPPATTDGQQSGGKLGASALRTAPAATAAPTTAAGRDVGSLARDERRILGREIREHRDDRRVPLEIVEHDLVEAVAIGVVRVRAVVPVRAS